MDSGSAVPTLSPGFNETVAAKVLTTARGRWGGALAGSLASSGRASVVALGPSEFRLLRSARFLAADNAGKRSAAITAMMTTTTSNSIRVKPRAGILIRCLMGEFLACLVPIRMPHQLASETSDLNNTLE